MKAKIIGVFFALILALPLGVSAKNGKDKEAAQNNTGLQLAIWSPIQYPSYMEGGRNVYILSASLFYGECRNVYGLNLSGGINKANNVKGIQI